MWHSPLSNGSPSSIAPKRKSIQVLGAPHAVSEFQITAAIQAELLAGGDGASQQKGSLEVF